MHPSPAWKYARSLDLVGAVAEEWEAFTSQLRESDIFLSDSDSLVWAGNPRNGSVAASLPYSSLINFEKRAQPAWWNHILWKKHVPSKVKCFAWLDLKHKILTWDLLMQQGH